MISRKVLFIINPNAGKKISGEIIKEIRNQFPANIYYQIVIWKDKEHFEEVTEILLNGNYTDAIAVGGDGTVNQVAKSILGTSIALGIVPVGSGNGLARTLGLSMNLRQVIREIVQGRSIRIDSGLVNGIPFFCTSGIGFDAHIGNLFATSIKRGLRTYVKITLRELFRYRASEYEISIGDETFNRKAFLITVANAGQYGNDFYIAPLARLSDGLFHVVILKPFTPISALSIFTKVIRRRAHASASIETYTADKVRITRPGRDTIHFDGEPMLQEAVLFYENKPASLKVIVGDNYLH